MFGNIGDLAHLIATMESKIWKFSQILDRK